MYYDKKQFEQTVAQFGEVFFVLDSGKEYIVHGREGYEIVDGVAGEPTGVRVEGQRGDEYIVAVFDFDDIEHHYTHKEI